MCMLGTEKYNNEIMRMNATSMICDKNKGLKFFFSEECINFCSSVNIQMGIKGVLNTKKGQDITKIKKA